MELNPKKTSLMVVDMQNDFANEKGSLYVPSVTRVIPNIKKLIKKARESKTPIFYTQDWHRPDWIEFKRWTVHCVQGSWGANIIEELKPKENDYCIKKQTYNAFYGTFLERYLKELKIDTLLISGTVSNICVLETAADASRRGYYVVIPIDAVASLDEFGQKILIHQMESLYGAKITTTEKIMFQ